MHIGVIGTGYVGLVAGACFSELGHTVTCVDNVSEKIADLQEGILPIHEPGLQELVNKGIREERLCFKTDMAKTVRENTVLFVCVGTPSRENSTVDLRYINEVADQIGRNMINPKTDAKVVVIKSTVPPGTAEQIKARIQAAQPERPVEVSVVSNPEFMREGSALEDFLRPARLVIGVDDPLAAMIMAGEVYEPLVHRLEIPCEVMSTRSAELVKYGANEYLGLKTVFMNEIAALCDAVDADVYAVAKAMGFDPHIGRKQLNPGPGVGGSCLPKDIRALCQFAEEAGASLLLGEAFLRANAKHKEYMVDKAVALCDGDVEGKTIAILGLSFKPNTDDIRESPALDIIQALQKQGAHIKAYDPVAMPAVQQIFGDVKYCQDSYEALSGADLGIVATEWNQFRALNLLRAKEIMKQPVLLDLRNIYEPATLQRLGFTSDSVGRRPPKNPDLNTEMHFV